MVCNESRSGAPHVASLITNPRLPGNDEDGQRRVNLTNPILYRAELESRIDADSSPYGSVAPLSNCELADLLCIVGSGRLPWAR